MAVPGLARRESTRRFRHFPPAVTIDHVLADQRIGIGDVSVHEIPGSDHRAVFAELIVPAG